MVAGGLAVIAWWLAKRNGWTEFHEVYVGLVVSTLVYVTATLTLSNATNASISDATGTLTITEDDSAPSLSINDVTTDAESGTATFTAGASGCDGSRNRRGGRSRGGGGGARCTPTCARARPCSTARTGGRGCAAAAALGPCGVDRSDHCANSRPHLAAASSARPHGFWGHLPLCNPEVSPKQGSKTFSLGIL